jgi:hypothetical protein
VCLATVVERAAGQASGELATDRTFGPLGIPGRSGQPVHAAGGNVPGMTATLRRLPVTGHALVVLTQTDGIDRILRLTAEILDHLCSTRQRPK